MLRKITPTKIKYKDLFPSQSSSPSPIQHLIELRLPYYIMEVKTKTSHHLARFFHDLKARQRPPLLADTGRLTSCACHHPLQCRDCIFLEPDIIFKDTRILQHLNIGSTIYIFILTQVTPWKHRTFLNFQRLKHIAEVIIFTCLNFLMHNQHLAIDT
jgi:hypothetical protein